jgi:hypothetical protein
MANLHNPLRIDVELENPETLEDVMALARAYEQRLTMAGDTPLRAPPGRSASYRASSKPLLLLRTTVVAANHLRKGFVVQDQLERFSANREHNQHT